jgi:predicted Zn-dependent peptidase
MAGAVTGARGTDYLTDMVTANEILGADFLSRMNMDLRESKGWAYGVSGSINRAEDRVPYLITAPVQADRTGDSILALQEQMRLFVSDKGITPEERERTIRGNILELPGTFETAASVLGAMQSNALYKRAEDFQKTLASLYRAMTVADLDKAARAVIRPNDLLWVVVGDAAKVRPQLEKVGLPVETMTLD